MAQKLRYPTTQDYTQKTLGAALLTGVTAAATLNNVTGIQNKPGVFIVDRVNTSNVETPTKREVIAYDATSGLTTTTLTRNADGSGTDQDHAVGAIVEFGPDILWAQAVIDGLTQVIDPTTGLLDTTKVADLTTSQVLINKDLSSATNTLPSTIPTKVGLQNGSYVYAADAGSNDAYVITLSPAPSAYAAGQVFHFKANTANTGAATLNVNSLGAKTIKKLHDQDLADNDIEANQIVTVVYDAVGDVFQMQSQTANSTNATSFKAGTFSRDISLAGSTVAYTGIGFTPKSISFSWVSPNKASGQGFADGTNQMSNFIAMAAGYVSGGTDTSKCLYISDSSGNDNKASLASFDADGFTITYAKTGSPTGTISIIYLAQK